MSNFWVIVVLIAVMESGFGPQAELIMLDAWFCLLCSQGFYLSFCTFSFVNLMEAEGEAKQTGRQKFAD